MKNYRPLRALLWIALSFAVCSACFAAIPDGSAVTYTNMSVTATFPGRIYVEKTDRSVGIRVDTGGVFAIGQVVNVAGTVQTDPATDERYVIPSAGYPQPTGAAFAVKPIGMTGPAFAGGDSDLHKGIPGDFHLNNVGLLVTTWGPVSAYDQMGNPATWFTVSEPGGPEIKVVVPGGVTIDKDCSYAVVTGICCAEKVGGTMTRVLKVRSQGDIVVRASRAAARLQTMTLDQKIGQLFQIRIDGPTLDQAERDIILSKHVGGIVYFQYNGNLDDPVLAATMSNNLQSCVLGTGGSGIPLFISMDQEGGRVTRITGGSDFPGNMAIGASRSTDMAYLAASTMGSEIKAVGANVNLAPTLDVNNNPLNPVIGVRSFGEDPGLASQMGIAYVNGLHSAGIIATGKHFPGHGDTAVDSHTGLPTVTYDYETLDAVHGEPFRQAIANGLDAIMSAHIVVTCLDADRPATLSPLVMQGYLRGTLGFDGVVMTDSMGMAGITSGYGIAESAVMAIQAGCDLLSLSPDLNVAWAAVKTAAQNGTISMSRINEAVTRILKLKYRYGLFDNPYVDAQAADDIVGHPDHWTAELSVARAGTTLVQNTGNILPLNLTSAQKVLLVTVQASETTTDAAARFASYITQKHSNVESLALAVNPTSSQRTTVKNAAATAYVTIIGTSRAQLAANTGQAALVNELKAQGRRVIVVGLREPYELASFPTANAYIAAYNYRNCGFQAAADVLFGDWHPTGLLPVTIPGLYAYGHGLSY